MEWIPESNEKENIETTEKILSIDYWAKLVLFDGEERFDELAEKIKESMKDEDPGMVSAILERACFLQCTHCLYQKDHKTSIKDSQAVHLPDVIVNLVKQLPSEDKSAKEMPPTFLHEGRMLRDWHFDVFERIRKERPDARISLIDAGNYTNFLDEFKRRNLRLNQIDISIDGNEDSHNQQRDPERKKAYDIAVNGLRHAREVILPAEQDGHVSSLLTLTNLNFKDIKETADFLFSPNPEKSAYDEETGLQLPYADRFQVSTMTPALSENFPIEISQKDMKIAWEQIKEICEKYLDEQRANIILKIYRVEDLEKLAGIVGEKTLIEAMTNDDESEDGDGVISEAGGIGFFIDGVPIYYYPTSTWPTETIHIDADGAYRAPLCQQWGIEELRGGKSRTGEDVSKYTFKQMDEHSSYQDSYCEVVDKYWEDFGENNLKKELNTFGRIKEKASKQ